MRKYSIEKSNEHKRRLSGLIPAGIYSNFRHRNESQIYFVKGKGSRLIDLDGNEYLDLFGNSGAAFLGHNNLKFKKRFEKYLRNEKSRRADIRSLELINEYIPCAEMIRFCLSGTEAIQNALRLARAYTGRIKILKFEGHYHGSADNILGGEYNQDNISVPNMDKHDIQYGRGIVKSSLQEQTIVIPWNDSDLFDNVMEAYGKEIAAVIMEPIAVNAGSILPSNDFLQRVRCGCNRYSCVLIFDEVITGIRVSLGGAQEILGITPDLAILGKALGGGALPVSAIVGKKEIMQLYANNYVIQGGTFNGYYVGQCAVCATFETLLSHDEYYTMNIIATKMKDIVIKYAQDFKIPLVIQGHLSCASFHYAQTEITSFRMLEDRVLLANSILRSCMRAYGILTASPSRLYTSIALSEEDISFLECRMEAVMSTAATVLVRIVNNESLTQQYLYKRETNIL